MTFHDTNAIIEAWYTTRIDQKTAEWHMKAATLVFTMSIQGTYMVRTKETNEKARTLQIFVLLEDLVGAHSVAPPNERKIKMPTPFCATMA